MSYEFIQTYNVAVESGCSTITEYTEEAVLQRGQAVKDWFDKNFNDLFTTTLVANSDELLTNYCYFKGTDSGIYLTQRNIDNYRNQNCIGIIIKGVKTVISSSCELLKGEINFCLIKSRYGFIAGFYVENMSKELVSIVIYHNARLYPIIFKSSSDVRICHDTQAEMIALPKKSTTSKAVLTALPLPNLGIIPQGVYWSLGAEPASISKYSLENSNKQFVSLTAIPYYNSIALELAEPTADDYKDIEPLPTEEISTITEGVE